MKNTTLLIVGIVCAAVIAVACLYFGKDGAILATILTLIGGAAGFGVSKVKDEVAPAATTFNLPQVDGATKAVSLVSYTVPAKAPMLSDKVTINFDQITLEIQDSIKTLGLPDNAQQEAALALNRSVGARVSSLDEVLQWNSYLMRKALAAVADLFHISVPDNKAALDAWVQQYVNVGCHPINESQKIALGWVNRVGGQAKALARLQGVGLDWNKLEPNYKTAWYIAELAYNPVVQIGISSEDII